MITNSLPAAAVAAMLLAGCSVVNSYDASNGVGAYTSGQSAGSYYLPKHVLTVSLQKQGANSSVAIVSEIVPDRSGHIDIGLDLSPLSSDDVKVSISEKGLLTRIGSINDDKTTEVVQALTKSVVSMLREAAVGGQVPTVVASHSFDPFRDAEMAETNRWLQPHGLCLAVEGAKTACSATADALERSSYVSFDIRAVQKAPGIYYRRPQSHRVRVFRRVRGGYILERSQMIEMANLSPALRLDVQRTAFVKRETTLTFAGGIPTEVQVVKPAEAVGLASLPLKVIEAANDAVVGSIARNVSVLQERKKEITAQTELLQARTAYLDAATEALKKRQDMPAGHDIAAATGVERSAPYGLVATGEPSASLRETSGAPDHLKFMKYCGDIGMDQPSCEKAWAQYSR
ncbi:hypothetical protein [Bosea sp. (in: a-proteobacteria)]|uniref:hypothetical protein n=1 Tax=Bosea sp. (in: a-proteobacteria) TaxID=1871050 RepID=UPI001208AAB8|nr:hypothetical protein [Bosea sp. (in: a-proteobacteria)]TAJ34441.1 MAG: hypothetical protein EPO59_01700 [Bosea sp. (in: a-proteobacteria)]